MIKTKGEIKNNFLTGDKPTQQQFADLIESSVGCIGKLIGANLNTVNDQLINLPGGSKFYVDKILILNPSLAPHNAADGEFWDDVNRGGNQIGNSTANQFVNSGEGLQGLTNADPNFFLQLISQFRLDTSANTSFGELSGNKLYFSLGTPEGAAATCYIYILGFPIA